LYGVISLLEEEEAFSSHEDELDFFIGIFPYKFLDVLQDVGVVGAAKALVRGYHYEFDYLDLLLF
ncbi:hypothetical protein L0P69_15900, partial [Faecalibacillus intestinalis]